MRNKYFKCFRCHFHNHFYIPNSIKGKKCKKCKTFNYFNYFKKRNNNQRNKNNQSRRPNLFFRNNMPNRRNILGNINNNMINRNQQREQYIPLIPFLDGNESDNNNNDDFAQNNLQIFSLNNENNFAFNNIINYINVNNNYSNNNNINDNFLENNLLNQSHKEYIDISWIKKEKITKKIIDKYGKDYLCSICLSELKDDIYITKCKHIFHYKCIVALVKNKIKECPNCRRNLRTEERMESNNLGHNNLNNNGNRNESRIDNINGNQNRNRNIEERNNHYYIENNHQNNGLNLEEKDKWNLLWNILFWFIQIFLFLVCGVAFIIFMCFALIILFYILIKVMQFCLAIGFLYCLLKCLGL